MDLVRKRPVSIDQYSNMASRLSGQTSISGRVFFIFKKSVTQSSITASHLPVFLCLFSGLEWI